MNLATARQKPPLHPPLKLTAPSPRETCCFFPGIGLWKRGGPACCLIQLPHFLKDLLHTRGGLDGATCAAVFFLKKKDAMQKRMFEFFNPKDHWTLKTGYFEEPNPAIQVQTLPLEGPRSLGNDINYCNLRFIRNQPDIIWSSRGVLDGGPSNGTAWYSASWGEQKLTTFSTSKMIKNWLMELLMEEIPNNHRWDV